MASEATMARSKTAPVPGKGEGAAPRARSAGEGTGMLRRLAIAALIALIVGPAFTFHRSARLHLPAPTPRAALAVGAAAVTLEPLLPSGLF
jgi:hypothetical protein